MVSLRRHQSFSGGDARNIISGDTNHPRAHSMRDIRTSCQLRQGDVPVAPLQSNADIITESAAPLQTLRLAPPSGIPLSRRAVLTTSLGIDPTTVSVYSPLHFRRAIRFRRPRGSSPQLRERVLLRPEWVLEAPRIVDDFYSNVLSWSCKDVVALALRGDSYLWRSGTDNNSDEITQLRRAPRYFGSISSIEFSDDGQILGVGLHFGSVELWDLESQSIVRTFPEYSSDYESVVLSWNRHILSCGFHDGHLWHYDVRMAKPKVLEFHGHGAIVTGLKWGNDGEMLANSSGDGTVTVWDFRVGDVKPGARGVARWANRDHGTRTIVKALAWCPWDRSLLASGGGIPDGRVRVWNAYTGERVSTLDMDIGCTSQITSIQWAPHQKEFMITLGFGHNGMLVNRYPSGEKVLDIPNAHGDGDHILWSALGPSGDIVCTGGVDGNLKFWKIWEGPRAKETAQNIASDS